MLAGRGGVDESLVRESSLDSRTASDGKKAVACHTCAAKFSYAWRYQCSDCSNSFCGAHARDSWLSDDDSDDDSSDLEAPPAGRVT
ncbi:hypothetical protein T484DRAFT_1922909 [Baffinella frigidus]|nr:hypothetical protein T484DRAFT_1922909 [Cryptophyta sp. CCMP2293]